jgi:hypothetical protein
MQFSFPASASFLQIMEALSFYFYPFPRGKERFFSQLPEPHQNVFVPPEAAPVPSDRQRNFSVR